jgi:drug/metabolite transporter (DMT)-like permease
MDVHVAEGVSRLQPGLHFAVTSLLPNADGFEIGQDMLVDLNAKCLAYCKGLMRRFSEIEILIFSYVTASAASLPLLIWAEPFSFRSFQRFDWQSWTAFAFLALFMYGASMLLFFKALQHLDVTTASASLYLVPVFGVLLAAILLGERLNTFAISGAAIVLAATVLIMKYDTSY